MFLLLCLSILSFTLVNSFETIDQEKYIDLLPEEEKKAFLETVARRLIKAVKDKELKYKSSAEISDKEANGHNEEVQQTLDEPVNLKQNGIEKNTDEAIYKIGNIEDKDHINSEHGSRKRRNDENDKLVIKLNDDVVDTNSNSRQKRISNEDIQVRGPRRKFRRDMKKMYDQENVMPDESTKTIDDEATYSSDYTKLTDITESPAVENINAESYDNGLTSNDTTNKNVFKRASIEVNPNESLEVKNSNKNLEIIDESKIKDGNLTLSSENNHSKESESNIQSNNNENNNHNRIEKEQDHHFANTEGKKYRKNLEDANLAGELNEPTNETLIRFNSSDNSKLQETETDATQNNHDFEATNDKLSFKLSNEKDDEISETTNEEVLPLNKEGNESLENEKHKLNTKNSETLDNDTGENDDKLVPSLSVIINDDQDLTTKRYSTNEKNKAYNYTYELDNNESIRNKNISGNGDNSNQNSDGENVNTNNFPTVQSNILITKPNKEIDSNNNEEGENNSNTNSDNNQNTNVSYKNTEKSNVSKSYSLINVDYDKEIPVSIANNTFTEDKAIKSDKQDVVEDSLNKETILNDFTINSDTISNDKHHVNKKQLVRIHILKPNNRKYSGNNEKEELLNVNHNPNNNSSNVTDLKTIYSNDSTNNVKVTGNYGINIESGKLGVKDELKKERDVGLENDFEHVLTTTESNGALTIDSGSYLNDDKYIGKNKIPEILRHGSDSEIKKDFQDNVDISNGTPVKKIKKEYLVYEIPEGQTPFVKEELSNNILRSTNNDNQDQPQFVPVYNYAPHNAYYNSYNRLGPNDEERQDYENVNTNEKSNGNNYLVKDAEEFDSLKYARIGNNYLSNPELSENKGFHTYSGYNTPLSLIMKKPQNFNPDMYFDLDYFFERSHVKPELRAHNNNKYISLKNDNELNTDTLVDYSEENKFQRVQYSPLKDYLAAVKKFYASKNFDLKPPSPVVEKVTPHPYHNQISFLKPKTNNEVILLRPRTKFYEKEILKPKDLLMDYYYDVINDRNTKAVDDILDYEGEKEIEDYKNIDLTGVREQHERNRSDKKNHRVEAETNEVNDIIGANKNKQVTIFETVLSDMIEMDSKALVQYDWLGSTVDVLSALTKIQWLTKSKIQGKSVHPADLRLLNYILQFYKYAKNSSNKSTKDSLETQKMDITRRTLEGPRVFREPNMYYKRNEPKGGLWHSIEVKLHRARTKTLLRSFMAFLNDLQNSLYDLHNTIKKISLKTTYKKQKWLINLKKRFLKNPQKKRVIEVLIHIFTSRLIDLIEESVTLKYKNFNNEESNKIDKDTIEEFAFVLNLLKVYKQL